jgi:hypothetical protein
MPAAAQAATNDLGVTQTLSATRVKPNGKVEVSSSVTNLGTQNVAQAFVELAALKGKILTTSAPKDPYTSFSTSQGSCQQNDERGITPQAVVCSLGALAPGQSAQIHATIKVGESAVQTTSLLPKPGENEYTDDVKSNNAFNQPFYLDVPPTVSGAKGVKLSGLPKGCVRGNFTLTAKSKVAGTKKMRINVDLGFDTKNGKHLLFKKEVKGSKITMKIPASKAEFQIDEGAFPSYTIVVKTKLGGRALKTTVKFKRC